MSNDRLVTASQTSCPSGERGTRRIHAGEEVDGVAMLDHHAFRPAGRSGGIDHVG